MESKNYRTVFDQDVFEILKEFPFSEVTWHESDPPSVAHFTDQTRVNLLLQSAQAIISSKYIEYKKELTPIFSRVWKGKTSDGENRDYHSDKLFEIETDGKNERDVSNIFALYYHCDLAFLGGGLKFWNRITGEKEVVVPKFGELVIIDEREDDIWHKVLPTLRDDNRYVIGFGFYSE
jgi:hypothetical protein